MSSQGIAGEFSLSAGELNVEGLLDIQSLDVVADGKELALLVAGRLASPGSSALAYLVSSDSGKRWSKPALVKMGRSGSVASKRGNDAQLAKSGKHLVAAWQAAGETPGSGPIAVAYSKDGGKHWLDGQMPTRADPTGNQSYLDLAADRQGNFHLVWLDDREERGDSQGLRYAYSSDGGRAWRGETTIDEAVCTCCWNRLSILPDGALAVLYRDSDPHDMRLSLGTGNPRAWKNAGSVGAFNWHFTGCPHCGGGLAGVPSGASTILHGVVWTGVESGAGLYHLASVDSGAHWSAPQQLGGGLSREADVAAEENGWISVVYSEGDEEGVSILWRFSKDGGASWSTPERLSGAGLEADHPRVNAVAGGFRAFWTEKRSGAGKVLMTALIHNKKTAREEVKNEESPSRRNAGRRTSAHP